MNDENGKVVNIRTGRPDTSSPTWAMLERLISLEGVHEVVSVTRDILSEIHGKDEIAKVLDDAVRKIEVIEDQEALQSEVL